MDKPAPNTNFFIHIHSLLEQTKYDKVITELEGCITEYQDDSTFFNLLGQAYLKKGQIITSIQYLSRAMEIDSEDSEILELLGDAYRQLGNMEQALSAYSQAINVNPNPGVLKKYGEILYKQGEYSMALEVLNESIDLNEDAEVYSLLADIYKKIGNDVTSWNMLLRAENLAKENDVRIMLQIGQYYEDINNKKKAIEYFEKVTSIDPNNFSAWLQLGNILEKNEDLYGALAVYNKLTELEPDNPLGYYKQAVIKASIAEIADALVLYNICLDKDPGFIEASIDIASLLWVSKKPQEAITYLKEALKYNKNNTNALEMIGDIYESMGELEIAEKFWKKAEGG